MMTMAGAAAVPIAPAEKWYEKPGGMLALVLIVLVVLVVFETFMFKGNPAALAKILGAIAALATAMAGFLAGVGRGKKKGRKEATDTLGPVIRDLTAAASGLTKPEPAPAPAVEGTEVAPGGGRRRYKAQGVVPIPEVVIAAGQTPADANLVNEVNRAYAYMDAVT
jgi:hypothetical protein